jgi:hypothetical protein
MGMERMKGNTHLSTWVFGCSYIHILNTFEVNDNIVNIFTINLLNFKAS